ncbi:MAG TPA: ABC transporter permease subunit [Chloroflexota bacterium]|nr:ABC transporter permease subunit [Chloroflexota bacterium]
MTLTGGAVRALLGKELLQLRRSRGALISSTLLPLLMMLGVPLMQVAAFRSMTPEQLAAGATANPANAALLARFERPMDLFTGVLLPLFVAMTGVLVPAVATAYAVVAERERRSLDLLMALPVSVADVLVAKVLSVFVMAVGVVAPLFAIQSAVLLALGVTTLANVFWLLVVLAGAFCCSIGVTFVITIVARDYRTANNLSGLQVGPVVILAPLCLLALRGWVGFALLALIFASIGLIALVIAWRWITFERYLA